MADYARGRDIQIQVIQEDDAGNASVAVIGSPVSGSFNMDVTNERDDRLGEAESDTTQVYEGESGQLVFNVDSHELHNIQMRIRDAARDGLKTPKFDILRTVYIRETSTSKSLLYPNAVFNFSDDAGGKNDALRVTVEFMSGFAQEI